MQGALQFCGYSEGGGMNGGRYTAHIARQEDGRILFEVEEMPWHHMPVTKKQGEVPAEKFRELEGLLAKYDFDEPNDPRLKEFFLLDAPHVGLSVKYDNASYCITGTEASMQNVGAIGTVRRFFDSL